MKKVFFLAAFGVMVLVKASFVEGRILPRFKATKKSSTGIVNKLSVKAHLRSDRKALIVTFSNLNKVQNVFYSFMYEGNGIDQGVNGSLDSSLGDTVTRELLFGTCSSGVCRYHGDLKNMKLEVTSDLPSGKRVIKRFRVRI